MSAMTRTYDVGLRNRRSLVNKIALALSLLAMAIGIAALVWILFDVIRLGMSALSPTLFTQDTPAPGSPGG
jgi:phosphate transport system permease protein